MRGKAQAKKREIAPDEKYNSTLVSEFINKILINGYKDKAKNIVYGSLEIVEKNTKKPALEALETAIKFASPQVEVKSKRIGGANYQVPMEVPPHRKIDLVFRWLIGAARTRHGQSMEKKLAEEITAMYKGEGAVIKKRDDVHRMAEANKAFAHFARF
jgi:small subunit ribosomal protein S7